MKTVAINIDGTIRDFISKFDFIYRKKFIHNASEVDGNIPTHTDVASGNIDESTFQLKEEFSEEEMDALAAMIEEKENELLSLPVDTDDLTNHYRFEPKKLKVISFDDNKGDDEPIRLTSMEVLDKFIYEDYPFQIFGRADQYKDAMETVNKIQAFGRDKGLYKTILVSTCKQGAIPATFAFLSTHHCRVQSIHFVDSNEEKWDLCDILIDDTPEAIHSKPMGKELIKIERPWNKWDKTPISFESLAALNKNGALKNIVLKEKI